MFKEGTARPPATLAIFSLATWVSLSNLTLLILSALVWYRSLVVSRFASFTWIYRMKGTSGPSFLQSSLRRQNFSDDVDLNPTEMTFSVSREWAGKAAGKNLATVLPKPVDLYTHKRDAWFTSTTLCTSMRAPDEFSKGTDTKSDLSMEEYIDLAGY